MFLAGNLKGNSHKKRGYHSFLFFVAQSTMTAIPKGAKENHRDTPRAWCFPFGTGSIHKAFFIVVVAAVLITTASLSWWTKRWVHESRGVVSSSACRPSPQQSTMQDQQQASKAREILHQFHLQELTSHAMIPDKAEILIILGHGQHMVERIFDLTDKQRLHVDTAIEQVRQDPRNKFILVTGGYGEAILMANYAIQQLSVQRPVTTADSSSSSSSFLPLHPMQVMAESSSRTTLENAINTRDMLLRSPIIPIYSSSSTETKINLTLVASAWHLPRARLIFQKVFVEDDNFDVSDGIAVTFGDVPDLERQVQILKKNVLVLREMGYSISKLEEETTAREIKRHDNE